MSTWSSSFCHRQAQLKKVLRSCLLDLVKTTIYLSPIKLWAGLANERQQDSPLIRQHEMMELPHLHAQSNSCFPWTREASNPVIPRGPVLLLYVGSLQFNIVLQMQARVRHHCFRSGAIANNEAASLFNFKPVRLGKIPSLNKSDSTETSILRCMTILRP